MKGTYLLMILGISACLLSCKKPKTYCGAEDPTTEIAWIRNMISEKGDRITLYEMTYNDKVGFYWVEELSTNGNFFVKYYNNCDNTNIYHASNGIVYTSNFPDDFFSNPEAMSKIYPN